MGKTPDRFLGATFSFNNNTYKQLWDWSPEYDVQIIKDAAKIYNIDIHISESKFRFNTIGDEENTYKMIEYINDKIKSQWNSAEHKLL